MTPTPDEVFCMTCGPAAVLDRDPRARVLRCLQCGDTQRVPALPLFVVTGPSGAGKTTVTGPLRRLLPDCAVFEADLTLQIAALDGATWRDTWLRVAYGEALQGRATVLCGSLLPEHLESVPARKLLGPIHFCTLDCPDDVLAARLRARPSWRNSSTETVIAQHQRFAAWLRTHIQPCFDTSGLTPDETAEHIASWVRTRTVSGLSPYARAVTPEALVRAGTSWAAVPFVPEIRLLTAAEPFRLWDMTAQEAPPFWAFPWAGGQALARYVLDHSDIVRGRRVLDVASGSGLVAIAAARAGATSVTAGDVDLNAVAAIGINARANGAAAAVTAQAFDLAVDESHSAQVILAADVFYQRELAAMALRFLRRAAGEGAGVLVADPGRAFLPAAELTPVASYEVPVLAVLEDAAVKAVTVYRLA